MEMIKAQKEVVLGMSTKKNNFTSDMLSLYDYEMSDRQYGDFRV